jgi:hypothetical protein
MGPMLIVFSSSAMFPSCAEDFGGLSVSLRVHPHVSIVGYKYTLFMSVTTHKLKQTPNSLRKLNLLLSTKRTSGNELMVGSTRRLHQNTEAKRCFACLKCKTLYLATFIPRTEPNTTSFCTTGGQEPGSGWNITCVSGKQRSS